MPLADPYGPCYGVDSADSIILSKWLLHRIAEKYGYNVIFDTKPYDGVNSSGCHINYSTKETRANDSIETLQKYMDKLQAKHSEHIDIYGQDNDKRLTGKNETSSIDTFSWGIGTRNTSIRIPNKTKQYFEDRRPASTIDYYLTTAKIHTTCL